MFDRESTHGLFSAVCRVTTSISSVVHGENLNNVGVGRPPSQKFDNSDTISTVMSDLMERMTLGSKGRY